MEAWNLLVFSFALALALAIVLLLRQLPSTPRAKNTEPPFCPPRFPIIGNLLLIFRPFVDLGKVIARLSAAYGPVVTLYAGRRPFVYIVDRSLAHQALVEKTALFADRPPPFVAGLSINSAAYGAAWRLLPRNLTSGVLHPSRLRSCSWARERALAGLIASIKAEAESGDGIIAVYDHIYNAIFRVVILMCFGDVLSEEAARDVIRVQCELAGMSTKLFVIGLWPMASKVFMWRTWIKLRAIRREQEALLSPLIRASRDKNKNGRPHEEPRLCYLDTLIDLELPGEGGRKLNDNEVMSLCSEFLGGGTETTASTLLWIMANLVKQQDLQKKLRQEIREVMGTTEGGIGEEDLQKATYLKAAILEALRRHPPAHFVVPHVVSEDVLLDKYMMPKGAMVNFALGQMGRDARVWEKPMEFRPERFLAGGEGEGVDITGNREIKMMPFGAGRRICPGIGLAMLHVEYFASNLVREFEWKPASDGEEVDLSEKFVFPIVPKHPLRVRIVPQLTSP